MTLRSTDLGYHREQVIKATRHRAAKLLTEDALSVAHPFSTPTPRSDSACHDRQSSSTGGSYYHLADDRDDVEAPQGWDQELKDFPASNSAYSARNRVSGGT
jgi:hypothetical protein